MADANTSAPTGDNPSGSEPPVSMPAALLRELMAKGSVPEASLPDEIRVQLTTADERGKLPQQSRVHSEEDQTLIDTLHGVAGFVRDNADRPGADKHTANIDAGECKGCGSCSNTFSPYHVVRKSFPARSARLSLRLHDCEVVTSKHAALGHSALWMSSLSRSERCALARRATAPAGCCL